MARCMLRSDYVVAEFAHEPLDLSFSTHTIDLFLSLLGVVNSDDIVFELENVSRREFFPGLVENLR